MIRRCGLKSTRCRVTLAFVASLIGASFIVPPSASGETTTVTAEGVGISPESATQNAAVNALKQVAGSFLDSETLLEKETVIEDGIRSRSKRITEQTREYSQGSISRVEVLDTSSDGELYRTSARVTVRMGDFSTYVRELAEGEADVDAGLFAGITANQDNAADRTEILRSKVLGPLTTAEVYDVAISRPISLREYRSTEAFSQASTPVRQIVGNRIDQAVVFEVVLTLDPDYKENLLDTLRNISGASETYPVSGSGGSISYSMMQPVTNSDVFGREHQKHFSVNIVESDGVVKSFLLEDAYGEGLVDKNGCHVGRSTDSTDPYCFIYDRNLGARAEEWPTPDILIRDAGGEVLWRAEIPTTSRISVASNPDALYYPSVGEGYGLAAPTKRGFKDFVPHTTLIAANGRFKQGFYIFGERELTFILSLGNDVLRNARSVSLEY